MSNLFISHSSRDGAAARELQTRLAAQGHRSVFLDFDPESGIQAGVSWERTLYTKLRACRAVVALCSDSYLASQWCFAEIALARMEGKEVFVLQIDPWRESTKLPSILTTEQVIDLRSDPEDGYRRLWNGFKVQGIVAAEAREWQPGAPPYPGLRAFDETDAPIFFGRDDEIREAVELLSRVRRLGHPRLVMVLGSSGSGKSSLVRAGVVPQLRRDPAQWLVVRPFRPGLRPMGELAVALSELVTERGQPVPWEAIHDRLAPGQAETALVVPHGEPDASGSDVPPTVAKERLLQALGAMEAELSAADENVASSVRWLRQYLSRASSIPNAAPTEAPPAKAANPLVELARGLQLQGGSSAATVALVIDQFEELLGHDPDHPASRFLLMLRAAMDAEDSPLLVIGTMRSDYLGALQQCASLQGVGFKSLSVGPMSAVGMRQLIEAPAQLGQVQLEPGLSDLLLADTQTSDALPLLAFTLRVMWDRFHHLRRFEIAAYIGFGRLQGAIAQVADETFDVAVESLPDVPAREALTKDLRVAFLRMARPAAEGVGWSRQPVSWDHLSPDVRPALAAFIDPQRLLVKRPDGTVEVAHEALFRSWGRLQGWLDENAEGLHLLREIHVEAATWSAAETDTDREPYLFRGGRLARARELHEAGVLLLEDIDRRFIEASTSAEQAQAQAEAARQRRELRRARAFAGVVGVLLACALGAFAVAHNQSNQARAQERLATSGRLASLAINELDRSLELSLLLSVQAHHTAPSIEARNSLATALARSPRLIRFLHGHTDRVRAVGFSPTNPLLLASGGDDKAIRLWDLASLQPTGAALLHEKGVNQLAFNPGGTLLAAASDAATVRLWDVATRAPAGDLDEPRGSYRVAFNAAGTLLASASEGTVRLWDTATRRQRFDAPLRAHNGATVLNVAFSPDGARMATSSRDQTVALWDVARGERMGAALTGHGDNRPEGAGTDFGFVEGLSFSPTDGTLLVSAGRDRYIRFWNVGATPPELLDAPVSNPERVMDVAFRADGRLLASSGYDGKVTLWDVAKRRAIGLPLTGHAGPVRGVALNADGTRLATASDDRSVGLWNVKDPQADVSFWQPRSLAGHEGGVAAVAFSPTEPNLLASAGYDMTVRLWHVDTGQPVGRPLVGHTDSVVAVAFSPDGKRLASGGNDGAVRLWDVASGKPLGAPLAHDAAVESVAFSADGQRLVSAGRDATVRLWDVATGRPVGAVLDAGASVFSVALSPDGSLLAAGLSARGIGSASFGSSSSGTIGAWKLATQSPERVADAFSGHKESVFGVAISPDGTRLASASRDRTVILWDVARRQPAGEPLAGHKNGIYSVAFSADGRRLASASHDRTVRLWDVATGQGIGPPLAGHGDLVEAAAFSRDGRTLASASYDGTIRLWDVDESAWPRRACAMANRNLSPREWDRYLGSTVAYCRTCADLPAPPDAPLGTPACAGAP